MKRALIAGGLAVAGALGVYRFSKSAAQVPIQITTTALPPATTGAPYSATIQATASALWFLWQYGPLPDGLGMNADSGSISGTPTAPGAYSVTVFAQDSSGAQTQPRRFTLVVQ